MFSFFSSRLGLPSTSSSSFQGHLTDADSVDADDVSSSGRSLSLPWPVTESRAKQSPGFVSTMAVPMTSTTPRRDFPPPPARRTTKNIVISDPIPRTQPNHLAAALTPPPPQHATLPGFSSNQGPAHPQDQGFRPTVLPLPQPPQHKQQEADITTAYEYDRPSSRRGLYPQSRFGHRQIDSSSTPPSGLYIPYAPPEVVRLDSGAEDGEETVVGEVSDSDPFREKEEKTTQKKKHGSQSPKTTSPYAYSPPTRPYEYTSNPSASSYALPIPDETKSISSIRSVSSAKSTSTAGSVTSTATSLKRHLTISNPLQSFTSSKKSPASEMYLSPFTVNDKDHTSSGGQRTYSYSETPSLSNASSRSEFNLDASKLDAFPPVPSSSPLGFMTKSRWNIGTNNLNNSNLRVQTPTSKIHITRPQAIYEEYNKDEDNTQNSMPMSNNMHSTPMAHMQNGLYTHKKPVPVPVPAPLSLDVPTDVYAHAYSYPLAKQLSPIAEQDYISPTTAGASDSQSVRFGRGGDGSSLRVDFEYPRLRTETGGSATGSISARSFSIKEKEMDKEKEKVKETIKEEVVAEKEPEKEKEVPREKEKRTRMGSGRSGSGGSVSDITRPSPIYTPTSASNSSPFLTRHLNMNRTVSQTSSKSDGQQQAYSQASQTSIVPRPSSTPATLSQSREAQTPTAAAMTPTQQTPTSAATTAMFTPTSTFGVQTPIATSMPIVGGSGPSANPYPIQIQIPPTAVLGSKESASMTAIPQPQPQPALVQDNANQPDRNRLRMPKIPSLPIIPPLDLRFSVLGSVAPRRNSREVRLSSMPAIESVEEDGSEDESYEEEDTEEDKEFEEDEDEEYDHESLHADSFVTADGNETIGLELIAPSTPRLASASASSTRSNSLPITTPGGSSSTTTGESFIHRRWDREAGLGFGTGSSSLSPGNTTTFRAKAKNFFFSHYTPAFWTFWLGFIFPVLWLIGGWHFTNKGEMPPKYTVWEWYFWRSGSKTKKGTDSEVNSPVGKKVSKKGSDLKSKGKSRRKGNETVSGVGGRGASSSTSGTVTSPALPRWIAERLSTDDGRLRRLTHDPKRSLRGISFGYPFVPRPPTYSLGNSSSFTPFSFVFSVLDLLYGVKLREVHGRPESARRMFDPWIQRCRYALCLAIVALAVGMLATCIYLIVVVV